MKRHRSIHIWLTLALIASMLLGACQSTTIEATEAPSPDTSQPTDAAETPAPSGDTQTQSAISGDVLLDPALASDDDSMLVNGYVYEGLVRLEGDSPVGVLAETWTVSDDGLDYIFNLRSGVVFHDGTPLDADAVIANFNRWFDPDDPLRGSGAYEAWADTFLGFKGETADDGTPKSFYDGIEKVNNWTILIHLNRQEPELLKKLSLPAFGIVSPTALAANTDDYGQTAAGAVGTGPYSVSEWTATSITLAPNADYWDTVPDAGLEFPLN